MDKQLEYLDFNTLRDDYNLSNFIFNLRQKLSIGFKATITYQKQDYMTHFNLIDTSKLPSKFDTTRTNELNVPIINSNTSLLPQIQDQKLETIDSSRHMSISRSQVQSQQLMDEVQNTAKTDFLQQLEGNILFQRLKIVRNQNHQGELSEALREAKTINIQASSLVLATKEENKSLNRQYIIICIEALCLQSEIMKKFGDFKNATRSLERCLRQFLIHDLLLVGKIYMELGDLAILSMDINKSLAHFYNALLIYERINLKLDIANCLKCLSLSYALLMEKEIAKKLCYEAIDIYRKNLIEKYDDRLADALYMLGLVFYTNKDYDFSLQYLLQAEEIKERIYVIPHLSKIKVYNLMGNIYFHQDDLPKAILHYEKAIGNYESAVNVDLRMSQVLNNLGVAYMHMQNCRKSKECYDRAMQIYKELSIEEKNQYMIRLKQNRAFLQKFVKVFSSQQIIISSLPSMKI